MSNQKCKDSIAEGHKECSREYVSFENRFERSVRPTGLRRGERGRQDFDEDGGDSYESWQQQSPNNEKTTGLHQAVIISEESHYQLLY